MGRGISLARGSAAARRRRLTPRPAPRSGPHLAPSRRARRACFSTENFCLFGPAAGQVLSLRDEIPQNKRTPWKLSPCKILVGKIPVRNRLHGMWLHPLKVAHGQVDVVVITNDPAKSPFWKGGRYERTSKRVRAHVCVCVCVCVCVGRQVGR